MASRGVNKVILIGYLGQDPEVRYLQSGGAVANLRLATSESWRDKQTNEMKEITEWHSVVLFGKVAEVAGEYLRKGSQIYIEGQLRTRKWQDQNGQDRYTTEVVVSVNGSMQMLGSRQAQGSGGTSQPAGASGGGNWNPQQQASAGWDAPAHSQSTANPRPRQQQSRPAPSQTASEPPLDFDDDIPF